MEELLIPFFRTYICTFTYQDHINYKSSKNLTNYNPAYDIVGYDSNWGKDNIKVYSCSSNGVVVNVGDQGDSGYGKFVKVKYQDVGIFALYAHASSTLVNIGDIIDINTPLIIMGKSGYCFGDDPRHTHWEVRDLNNIPIDVGAYVVDREDGKPSKLDCTFVYATNKSNDNQENSSDISSTSTITYDKDFHVGDIVKIKKGSKSYEGIELYSGIYNNSYRIDEIYQDRAVLGFDSICTAMNIKDLYIPTEESINIENNNEPVYYTVKNGDNLSAIAYTNNISLDTLLSLNNIENKNIIQIGQIIRIK